MKKLIALLAVLMLVSPICMANDLSFDFGEMDGEQQVLALDAPNLVRFSENWYMGSEIEKDIHNNNRYEGWRMIAKVTYYGTLKDFFKKAE